MPITTATARRPGGEMPVIFAAHGAPTLLDDAEWMADLASWATAMPKPASILMVSAHWEQRPTSLGAIRTVPLVYDFSGFLERYSQTQYSAPGAPELAARWPAPRGSNHWRPRPDICPTCPRTSSLAPATTPAPPAPIRRA